MSVPAPKVAPWEDFCLRLIAFYKLLHALFFAAVAVGLFKLRHHDVVHVLKFNLVIPYHLNPENQIVDWLLDEAAKITPHTLGLLGWAASAYSLLFLAEGVGLYFRQHWAEYLVVIVTGSLLPFELYSLYLGVEWWQLKVCAVLGNILIVGYLIHRLRLDAHNRKLQLEAEALEAATAQPAKPETTEVR